MVASEPGREQQGVELDQSRNPASKRGSGRLRSADGFGLQPVEDLVSNPYFPSAVLPCLVAVFFLGCGNTVPDGPSGGKNPGTAVSAPGHAPELMGFSLEFVEETGRSMLVASALLGDVDDNLVPEGTVTAVLLDEQRRERVSLDAVVLGAAPSRLPEPTMLEVDFSIADDPTAWWEVRLFVTDRDGLSSAVEKAVWEPVADSGL